MNFIKNKDVKRASYYVWFLGAKESKGLRGDEYVQPVLNYLLDNVECELEPSKVTLQVSSKGLKIIQILSVPRKSSKLNADQQLQLFAAGTGVKTGVGEASVMKSEQVKHHIPHDSISWVYQEDDVICAILLLYNPITRCPVHIHAYRCDSIQTANNLRQQLQTLVDRPENQKKFREIESRLAAKGLLIPPIPPPVPPPNAYHHGHHSGSGSTFDHEDHHLGPPIGHMRSGHYGGPGEPTKRSSYSQNHHHQHSPSASKTLNSDGRSTRTDGSDEMNSEESNSSDLGYAIRGSSTSSSNRNNKSSSPRDHHHPFMRVSRESSSKTKPTKYNKAKGHSELPVDPLESTSQPNLFDSLAAELRAKLGNPKMGPLLLPPRDYDSQKSDEPGSKTKNGLKSKLSSSNPGLTRSESSGKSSSGIGSDEQLNGTTNNNSNHNNGPTTSDDRDTQVPLRSYYFESKPPLSQQKSSSSSSNNRPSYLVSDHPYDHEYDRENLSQCSSDQDEDSFDVSRRQRRISASGEDRFHGSIDCLEVDVEDFEEDVIFTAPSKKHLLHQSQQQSKQTRSSSRLPTTTSTSSSNHQQHRHNQHQNGHHLRSTKSSFDLVNSSTTVALANNGHNDDMDDAVVLSSSSSTSRHHLTTSSSPQQSQQSQFYRQQKQHQFHPVTSSSSNHHRDVVGLRDNHSDMFNDNGPSSSSNGKKSSSSNANHIETQRTPLKEVNHNNKSGRLDNNVFSNKSSMANGISSNSNTSQQVIGRREQRHLVTSSSSAALSSVSKQRENGVATKPPRNHQQPTQKFYFADAEFSSSSSKHDSRNNHHNGYYHRGRSMGRLDQMQPTAGPDEELIVDDDPGQYGPMSLNFPQHHHHQNIDMNDRSISPYYFVHSQQQPPPSSNHRNFVPKSGGKSMDHHVINKRYQPPEFMDHREHRQRSQSRDRSNNRSMFIDQPYSRYSYIDVGHHHLELDHHRRQSPTPPRFHNPAISNQQQMLMLRNKR